MENKIFEQIKNDANIIKIYEDILKLEELSDLYHDHSFIHINNVINTVEIILKRLNYMAEKKQQIILLPKF